TSGGTYFGIGTRGRAGARATAARVRSARTSSRVSTDQPLASPSLSGGSAPFFFGRWARAPFPAGAAAAAAAPGLAPGGATTTAGSFGVGLKPSGPII